MDFSLPGSSVHGILQARILKGSAISFPGDLPNPGIEPKSPALQADSLPTELQGGPIFHESQFSKPPCTLHSVCVYVCVCVCVCVRVCVHAQLCLTLCHPMDYSPPSSSDHGIFQARILELVSISYSRGSSWPRDQTVFLVPPALAGRFFTTWATWEACIYSLQSPKWSNLVWPLVLKFYV